MVPSFRRRRSMNRTTLLGSLVLALAVCTQSFGFELLDAMLGGCGCGCETSCCSSSCCKQKCCKSRCCNSGCNNGCHNNCGNSCGCGAPACGAPACAAPACAAPT